MPEQMTKAEIGEKLGPALQASDAYWQGWVDADGEESDDLDRLRGEMFAKTDWLPEELRDNNVFLHSLEVMVRHGDVETLEQAIQEYYGMLRGNEPTKYFVD